MRTNNTRFRQSVKKALQKVRLAYLAQIDVARFARTASFSAYDSGYEQVVSRIMYNVHALEKGLARVGDRRLGFGSKALADLNDALVVYVSQGYDQSAFAFVEGLSVLQRYLDLHGDAGFDATAIRKLVNADFLVAGERTKAAGTKIVRRLDKMDNHTKSFYEIAQARSSVREFSGDPIERAKVLNALRNAEKTPSVCNRQGWRVYWVDSSDLASQVLKHQRGFGYPQMPEVLLTVTISNNTFLSPVERNEAFVDGGLFAMSVLYGLEHEGLAAVPLNAMMYAKDQRAVRQLLDIDDSEMIIMFIGVGAFPEETTVPISDRKPAESFIRYR